MDVSRTQQAPCVEGRSEMKTVLRICLRRQLACHGMIGKFNRFYDLGASWESARIEE
jgi:hypothetical protein